jgi:hypothetical protein
MRRYLVSTMFRHVLGGAIRDFFPAAKVKVKFRCGALFSTEALSAYCTTDPK